MSFGDFEMGFVVDGNSGNPIHNIQVKYSILVRTFFLVQYDGILSAMYNGNACNNAESTFLIRFY